MMKIKLADLEDLTECEYLDQNPDFADQLVATLNQVDGYNCNDWWFAADSPNWTYDYYFSPNYEINKRTFAIYNNHISIRSTNRDDLLNLKYYQQLMWFANKHLDKDYGWIYFSQDQVLQWATCLNIKLTKPIDQYNQKQINTIEKFITDVYDLIIKDNKFDWEQFDEQWKQGLIQDNIQHVGIVFDLNNFTNPNLLMRWWYENELLKNLLKADAPLLKFLNESDFATHFQPYQSKANKFFKMFLDA